jgi:hypothetical protein
VVAGVVVALGSISTGGYYLYRSKSVKKSSAANVETVTSAEQARRLDGVLVPAVKANFLPLAVVIENHSSVRPQSGLSQAGVVYEALAEGGITRFLAVFAINGDLQIGPVRSARPYFVQLARAYNGMFVHAGYSPQAKEQIQKTGIVDFDQFAKPYNFDRISGRPSEHALFTSLRLLELGRKGLKLDDKGTFTPWSFKDDRPVQPPVATKVTVDFSTASYRVGYAYDAATNSYLRSQGGIAAKDKENGQGITPKNVVVLFTTSTLFDALRRNILVVGEGKALVFQDGNVIVGKWRKPEAATQLTFTDANGEPLSLNRGQTWVEVVDLPERNVTYS